MSNKIRELIKSIGGTVATEASGKMVVKHSCTITLPVADVEIIGCANAPTEDAAVEWAMYSLKLKMADVNGAYSKLRDGYQEPTGIAVWWRRLLGGWR